MEIENIEDIEKIQETDEQGIEEQQSSPETHESAADAEIKEEIKEEAVAAEKEAAQASIEGEQQSAPEPVEYQANKTYRYANQDFEFPEGIEVKTQEQEEYFRDVLTKAHGFDTIKEKGFEAQRNFEMLQSNVDTVVDHMARGDFKAGFEYMGMKNFSLPELLQGFGVQPKDIIQHAYELANQSPEQLSLKQQQFEQQKNQQLTEQRLYQREEGIKKREADWLQNTTIRMMQSPSIAPVVEAFDRANGPDSFWNEVVMRGDYLQRNNMDYSPDRVVNDIVSRYNLGVNSQQQGISPGQPAATGQPQMSAQSKPEQKISTIPAVEGSTGSPAERAINSLEDVERLRAEMIPTSGF